MCWRTTRAAIENYLVSQGYTKLQDNASVQLYDTKYIKGSLRARIGINKINTYDTNGIKETFQHRTIEEFIHEYIT